MRARLQRFTINQLAHTDRQVRQHRRKPVSCLLLRCHVYRFQHFCSRAEVDVCVCKNAVTYKLDIQIKQRHLMARWFDIWLCMMEIRSNALVSVRAHWLST